MRFIRLRDGMHSAINFVHYLLENRLRNVLVSNRTSHVCCYQETTSLIHLAWRLWVVYQSPNHLWGEIEYRWARESAMVRRPASRHPNVPPITSKLIFACSVLLKYRPPFVSRNYFFWYLRTNSHCLIVLQLWSVVELQQKKWCTTAGQVNTLSAWRVLQRNQAMLSDTLHNPNLVRRSQIQPTLWNKLM